MFSDDDADQSCYSDTLYCHESCSDYETTSMLLGLTPLTNSIRYPPSSSSSLDSRHVTLSGSSDDEIFYEYQKPVLKKQKKETTRYMSDFQGYEAFITSHLMSSDLFFSFQSLRDEWEKTL